MATRAYFGECECCVEWGSKVCKGKYIKAYDMIMCKRCLHNTREEERQINSFSFKKEVQHA